MSVMQQMTAEQKIEAYVQLRDYVEAQEKSVKAQLKPYKDALQAITTDLLGVMNAQGIDNIKTPGGTAYRKEVNSVSVQDWDQALGFIIEQRAWHFLDRRVNATAAADFLAEHQAPVPGCKHDRAMVVQIRRSNEK